MHVSALVNPGAHMSATRLETIYPHLPKISTKFSFQMKAKSNFHGEGKTNKQKTPKFKEL